MNIDQKISKLAEWILYESGDSFEEVEYLLFAIYNKQHSILGGDIDKDYKEVWEHLGIEVSK